MIRVNTVLILGAGASVDFGYPLGEDLKEAAIKVLSNSEFQDALKDGYGTRPAIKYLIESFIQDFRKDKALTIDRFLAKSDKEYKLIGKVAIAKAIVNCENDHNIFQNQNSWYKALYSLITNYPSIEYLGENKLSIITFNYDRSLEHFLFEQLLGDYGEKNRNLIVSLLRKIPIIHLHGRVNLLPWEDIEGGHPYSREEYVPNIFKIAEEMKLPDDEHVVFNDAYNLIEKAEVIYFLGFGYDQTNLKQLNINLISKCKRILGTCYNIPLAKQGSINRISGAKINFYPIKIYDFLMKNFDPNRDTSFGGHET